MASQDFSFISLRSTFLIGAPLGSIIRKGGLGSPLVFSIVFFYDLLFFKQYRGKNVEGGISATYGWHVDIYHDIGSNRNLSYQHSIKRFSTLQQRILFPHLAKISILLATKSGLTL